MAGKKKTSQPLASTPDGILHLNRQQLFYLFTGLLLIGGLVFALGIMTGKRMVSMALNNTQDLETLDIEADIHKKVVEAVDKEKKPAQIEDADKQKEPKKVKEEKKKEPEKQVKEEKKKAEAAPEKVKEAKTTAAQKKEAEPKKEKTTEKPKQADEKKPEPKKKEAEREKPKKISTPNQPPPSKEYDPKGIWTIQVGSVATEEQATRMLADLKKKGYRAGKKTVDLKKKGTRIRIRVGRFSTKEDASEFQKKYEAKEKTQTIISRF